MQSYPWSYALYEISVR